MMATSFTFFKIIFFKCLIVAVFSLIGRHFGIGNMLILVSHFRELPSSVPFVLFMKSHINPF